MHAVGVLLVAFTAFQCALRPEASPVDHARRHAISLASRIWSNASAPGWGLTDALSGVHELTAFVSALNQPHLEFHKQRALREWSDILQRSQVATNYESFALVLSHQSSVATSDKEWQDISRYVFAALPDLQALHRSVVSEDTVYGEAIKEHMDNICHNGQSTQQLLYSIYASVQMTFLKAYVMAQSSWLLLNTINKDPQLQATAENMTRMYEVISRAEAEVVKRYLGSATRSFWRCDPPQHKEDDTYTSLKGLLQGYVVNEVDLNPIGSCQWDCKRYTTATFHGCHGNNCPPQRPCQGRIFNCAFHYADMRICMAPATSSRRYDFIQFNNGTPLRKGNQRQNCDMHKVDSWWRVVPPYHCTYCFCQCEDHEDEAERYFSLDSPVADVARNKLVTGVRLIKLNRTIHIQVQQATLLPEGDIDPATLEWVPVNASAPKFLMTYEDRKMDLDDIHAPSGYALTGMRFRQMDGRLNSQIMVTPIDYAHGTLVNETTHSYWHGNRKSEDSHPYSRRELRLRSDNVDLRITQNTPDSSDNEFITFGASSFDTDVAQTTIPLIDIQPVVPKNPSILSGAGMYHKGTENSVGFVAVRIFTYDVSNHIDE